MQEAADSLSQVNASTSVDQSDFYNERAGDFVELHNQVETSVTLLDSLESFISTFQKDLSAVSGQISELQARSKDFEGRLKGRRKIEKPLSDLITDLCIPPPLATIILDTEVGEPWLAAILQLERHLDSLKARTRVKAARDLTDVGEGLRIAASTKIRAFLLALIQPIRTSMTTNMQVLQNSILLKYRPLFNFLRRHASNVALEIQKMYIGAARLYYETGFRRYTRSLGYVKARVTGKSELIGSTVPGEQTMESVLDLERLSFAQIDGPNLILAYMADDKTYKQPIEALFRSMLLVLMDNSTSEYAFIVSFFGKEQDSSGSNQGYFPSPFTPVPFTPTVQDARTELGSDFGIRSPNGGGFARDIETKTSDSKALADLWKQIMGPALQYCQTFIRAALDPSAPPIIPLLTMIRINENVIAEVQGRNCPPLEDFLMGIRMSMWPVFQKEMSLQIESLKKLVDGSAGGILTKGGLKDGVMRAVAMRYASLFTSMLSLSSEDDEAMLFSNLGRLRQELARLITTQTSKIKDPARSAAATSAICESLLQNLSLTPTTHPKAQAEIAYWREREEAARRIITSSRK